MANLYVDGDNGNDANNGSTEALAFKTISACASASASNDTIYIQNNGSTVYNEQVKTANKQLTLIGYGSSITDRVRAVIDGTDVEITAGEGLVECSGATTTARAIRMKNIVVQNSTDLGYRYNNGDQWAYCILENCVFKNNGSHGCQTSRALAGYISYCIAEGNGGGGFVSSVTSDVGIWLNCVAYNNTGSGFSGYYSAANCLSVKNGNIGFYGDKGYLMFSNCVADANTGVGFSCGYDHGVVNCVATRNSYGFTSFTYEVGCAAGSGDWANTTGAGVSITGNPAFVAPYVSGTRENLIDFDYRMQSSSGLLNVVAALGPFTGTDITDSEFTHPLYIQPGFSPQITTGGGGIIRRVPRIIGA